MNIELEEVVVQDVSDDALELAAGGAQGEHCFVQAIFSTFAGVLLGSYC